MDSFPQPDIQLFREADESAESAVAEFRRNLLDDPNAYVRAVHKLAGTALDGTVSVMIAPGSSAHDEPAEKLVKRIFAEGYDKLTAFDQNTEAALVSSAAHQELVASLQKQHNILSKKGVMSTASVENPNARPARDKVRWSRLSFFVLRAAQWKVEQPSGLEDTVLPSAG